MIGCQTAHKYSEENQGYFDSKALIKDKKNNKNFIVRVEAYLKNQDKLRLEVSSPFGDLLGLVLLNGNKLEVLHAQKHIYYKGRASARALKPLLTIPLDPKIFYSIYLDRPMESKNWSCTNDDKGFLEQCKNLKSKLSIKWSGRINKKKLVHISHKKVNIQLNIRDFSPELKSEKPLFKVKVPKGYKKISI